MHFRPNGQGRKGMQEHSPHYAHDRTPDHRYLDHHSGFSPAATLNPGAHPGVSAVGSGVSDSAGAAARNLNLGSGTGLGLVHVPSSSSAASHSSNRISAQGGSAVSNAQSLGYQSSHQRPPASPRSSSPQPHALKRLSHPGY